MIILKTLKWANCFSYGKDNFIDLSECRLTQIVGTNGTGKSSIPLILEEILFNKNSKGVKKGDIANRAINDGYSIGLTLSKDGDEYEIEYHRKATAKVKLLKNGEDVSSHTATGTYSTIQDIIGVDFKTFSQLVYQNTNTSLQFLTATDTNRKKFLIDLLNLEHYGSFYDVFKVANKEASDSLIALKSEFESVTSWLVSNSADMAHPMDLVEVPEVDASLDVRAKHLDSQIAQILTVISKIQKNNQYRDMLKSLDIGQAKATLGSKAIISTDDERNRLAYIDGMIKHQQEIIKKTGKVESVCHACGQSIDTSEREKIIKEAEASKVQLAEERSSIANTLTKVKEHNKVVESAQKLVAEWEELYRCIDKELPIETPSKEKLSEELASIKNTIVDAREAAKKAQAYNDAVIAHNARAKLVAEQSSKMSAKLEELSTRITEKEGEVATLEVLKKSFSTNGLVAYKIENLVKDLEELTNHYLAELSDGRFTLQFIVSNDKLNVSVTDNGVEVDILALSSGELARVNTATLIAIRKLMSSISKSQINTLFLDEVINVLDEQGREKLVEVLLDEDLNTFIVSHQWTHPLLEKIEVVKIGGTSRLEVS